MKFENNNTIVNLSNSILKHFGVEPFHNTLPEIDEILKGHKKVVVLLFDAMGTYIEDEYEKYIPVIYKNRVHKIQSTFPPTTVAATTGFLTGKYPIETGWMSWTQYIRTVGCNVDVFKNRRSQTGETILESKSVLEDICPTNDIAELINAKKDKKTAFLMEDVYGKYHGPKNLILARWKLSRFIKNKEDLFMYYYYEKLDSNIHSFGVHTKPVKRKMKAINRFVKKISKKHKDTLFLVIADHGQVDTKWIELSNYPDFMNTLSDTMPISFEKSCPTFWVKDGQKETFEKLFRQYFGEYYDLYSKDEVYSMKIFGEGTPHKETYGFIGDYLAITKTEYAFYDGRYGDGFRPVGHHGGGTKEEMEISISALNK